MESKNKIVEQIRNVFQVNCGKFGVLKQNLCGINSSSGVDVLKGKSCSEH